MASINTGMPRISRNQDKCMTGHTCTGLSPVRATQFTVFANNKPILRLGDPVKPHTILRPVPKPPKCVIHRAKVKGSSRTVFVRGIGVARKGDRADKGAMAQASFDVVAG